MNRDYPPCPLPAALAGVVRDGKILLVRRAKEAPPRRWGLPGGLIEAGETAAQAALRELAEETGITAEAGAELPGFDLIERDEESRVRRHFMMRVIECRWRDGDGLAASDAAELGWFTAAQLADLPLHDQVAGLAARLLAPPAADPAAEARHLRAVFDSTFEFIGVLDPQGVVLQINSTALKLVGCTLDQVRGLAFVETPWWSHSPALQERLRQAIARAATGQLDRFEAVHPGFDGEPITVDFAISALTDETGRVTYLLPEGRDITARKQAEAALVNARLEALAANRAQTQFLAAASHELRTPLNAILGFAQAIEAQLFGPLGDERYGEYATLISQAGQRLDTLIADLLDIADAESGQQPGRDETIAITPLLARLIEMVRPRADAAGLTLTLALPDSLPSLWGEPARLRQIVFNLLDNAIKFTPRGGSVLISAESGDGMTLTVADTGIGIAADRQNQIWTPFHQPDAAIARSQGGHGMGLAMVHRLVTAHDGRIRLNSALGQGTSITIAFPPERLRATTPEQAR